MHNLFRFKKNNQYSIQKSNLNRNSNLIKSLTKEIWKIDQEIAQTSKDLLDVQIARFRASFSPSANLLDKLQKKFYWSTIENSSSFHTKHLISLYQEKKRLQRNLDRISGQFWKKRIYSWIINSVLILIIILIIIIIILGLIASLYLLPFMVLIFIIIFFLRK